MLDDVTGLRDSRALWRELAQRAASCSASSPLAVLVLDFDRLEELNERYDRSVGDAVLRRCASVAAAEAPSARLTFRYRDDELVVLVPGDEEDAREVGERIREQIAVQNHTLPAITVSCGIAVLRTPVEPLVAVGKGGPAIQAAKHAGGNRVVVASEVGRNGLNHRNGHSDDGTARRAALAMAVASLEARDRGTAAHSEDVVTLCESIGTRLGLSDEQLDRLLAAAQLHDVGKLAIPTEILNKPGPLDDDEWEIIRQHTVIGERMLRAVPEMGAVAGMVRHSHERWDGGGYPDGLAGDEIPLASRIVLCADAFHAIRSDRPYRPGRSADAALHEVRAHSGTQFDPRVVDALVAVARDVRRAAGGTALPRSRRLAALLAALTILGGGSAYAASKDVRSVVNKVVRVVVPGSAEPAQAADFSLRPIHEVPAITPVAAITPDLEFPELQNAAYRAQSPQAESDTGVPASAVSGGLSHGTREPLTNVDDPEEKLPPQIDAPPPLLALPPGGNEVVPSVPIDLVVQPEEAAPALVPVTEVEHEPAVTGNPHGGPPGHIKHDDDVQPVEDDADEGRPEHPHADGDLPPGLGDVIEKNPDHPHADDDTAPDIADAIEEAPDQPQADDDLPPELADAIEENSDQPQADDDLPPGLAKAIEKNPDHPHANVVTPTPSIAEPTETIFVPSEEVPDPPETVPTPAEPAVAPPGHSRAARPPVPAMRPPKYVPDAVVTETPTSE